MKQEIDTLRNSADDTGNSNHLDGAATTELVLSRSESVSYTHLTLPTILLV